MTVWTRSFHPETQWTTFFDYMRVNYNALKSSDPKGWLMYKVQSKVKLSWVYAHRGSMSCTHSERG